ncbi:MAG: hypothetical protein JRH07_04690 [Deltaproteobacteria bacterium]|nr:hypothetical protein [Deltaproteobacteria bacterium]
MNSGKTRMTLDFVRLTVDRRSEEVAVLDLAPETTRGIGGKMVPPPHPLIAYYTTKVIPPRLTGRDEEEVESYSLRNAREIERLFSEYLKRPRGVLVINDVSLYLQGGRLERLMEVLRPSHTAVINGYYGKALGEGPLSRRERSRMDRLAALCDRVIRLEP